MKAAWSGWLICLLIVSGPRAHAHAQQRQAEDGKTQSDSRSRPNRRSAANIREFLGLGRPPDAAAAARGEKLYTPNCSFCHGAKATGGDSGPDLVRSAVVLHDENGELVGKVVHDGRAEKGMPAFPGFGQDQLRDLAEFLHMKVELAANRGTYKLQDAITGDAKAGEEYFNNAGNCKSCHSVSGDLAHIGSKLKPSELQQTFLYPATSASEPRQQKVKVVLTSGETVSGVLKSIDDFNVSLYDGEGVYHSYSLEGGAKVEVEDKLAAHRALLSKYSNSDMHNLTAYLATLK